MSYVERKYAPSDEKVVEEEAGDFWARQNANMFVDNLLRLMDKSEYGDNALVPSPELVADRYRRVQANFGYSSPEQMFSLPDVFGAIKRQYLFLRELLSERSGRINALDLEQVTDFETLLTATYYAIPEAERPPVIRIKPF